MKKQEGKNYEQWDIYSGIGLSRKEKAERKDHARSFLQITLL